MNVSGAPSSHPTARAEAESSDQPPLSPTVQHMSGRYAATLLTSLLCTAVYNKPCLKYINLAHNNGNVHPEGETGVIDFLFLECFFLLTVN